MAGRQDPRLEDDADTVNEKLRDRSISHLLYLLRTSTKQANDAVRLLDEEVIPDLLDKLETRLERIEQRGFDLGPESTRRLEDLFTALDTTVTEGRRRLQENLTGELQDLAEQEAKWQVGAIQSAVPVNLEMVMPASETLRTVVTDRPFDGMPLSRWFDGLENDTQRRLEREIRQGVVQGESIDQIKRRVRGTKANDFADGALQTTRRNAEAIARTATIHTSTQARQRVFEDNAEVIRGIQWVATLDTRTCPTCQGLDGQGERQNGGRLPDVPFLNGRRPPAHTQCRCTLTPIVKSWRELGFSKSELSESTRASMDGQVPESLTYNAWLRRKVNNGEMDVVEEALGKKRAKAFAGGGLDVQEFTDRKGRQFTLKELRDREPDAFAAAEA